MESDESSAEMEVDFDFARWAKKYEIHTVTMDAMMEHGFETVKTIAKLTPALIDYVFRDNINMGQKVMLASASDEIRRRLLSSEENGGNDRTGTTPEQTSVGEATGQTQRGAERFSFPYT